MDGVLQRLIDERDVARLFHDYFERVDADDALGAAAHMTEDVAFEIMIGERRRGRDRYGRALRRVLDGYTVTSHHVSNLRTDLDGDLGTASCYVYAFHRLTTTGEPWHLWARIVDRVRREPDGRWRIAEHLVLGMDALGDRPDIPSDWYTPHPGRLPRSPG